MRDPERIIPILDALRVVWEQNPDLRLTQLLVNLIRPGEPCPRVFYFEDDELLKRLRRVAEVGWEEAFRVERP